MFMKKETFCDVLSCSALSLWAAWVAVEKVAHRWKIFTALSDAELLKNSRGKSEVRPQVWSVAHQTSLFKMSICTAARRLSTFRGAQEKCAKCQVKIMHLQHPSLLGLVTFFPSRRSAAQSGFWVSNKDTFRSLSRSFPLPNLSAPPPPSLHIAPFLSRASEFSLPTIHPTNQPKRHYFR